MKKNTEEIILTNIEILKTTRKVKVEYPYYCKKNELFYMDKDNFNSYIEYYKITKEIIYNIKEFYYKQEVCGYSCEIDVFGSYHKDYKKTVKDFLNEGFFTKLTKKEFDNIKKKAIDYINKL